MSLASRWMRCVALGLGGVLSSAAFAQTTIDFEGLPGMPNALGPVPAASQLNAQLQAATGATFTSPSGALYVAVVVLGAGHATSGVNGIGGANAGGNLDYSQAVGVTFSMPGAPGMPAATGSVSIRGDQRPATGSATLTAYDVGEIELGSVTQPDVTGGLTLGLTVPGIHRIVITTTQSNIALDDLTFGALQAVSVAPVPTLSELGLIGLALLLGATGLRACARRR